MKVCPLCLITYSFPTTYALFCPLFFFFFPLTIQVPPNKVDFFFFFLLFHFRVLQGTFHCIAATFLIFPGRTDVFLSTFKNLSVCWTVMRQVKNFFISSIQFAVASMKHSFESGSAAVFTGAYVSAHVTSLSLGNF